MHNFVPRSFCARVLMHIFLGVLWIIDCDKEMYKTLPFRYFWWYLIIAWVFIEQYIFCALQYNWPIFAAGANLISSNVYLTSITSHY